MLNVVCCWSDSSYGSRMLGQALKFQKQLRTNFYGVARDPIKAFQLFKRSAEAGSSDAAYNLGYMYYRGDGIGKSLTEALKWWKKASKEGHLAASYQAAHLLKKSSPEDRQLACDLFKRAAEGGLQAAFFEAGLCTLKSSQSEACNMFEKSHQAGFAEGTYNHAWCIHKTALDQAKDLLEQALRKGLAEASSALYMLNNKQSYEVLQKGASMGSTRAEFLLFSHLATQSETSEVAVSYLKSAAEHGLAEAQFKLGQLYYDGAMVDRNYESSFYWWKMAALQGHPLAQYNLGHCYLTGRGVRSDLVLASTWFHLAARYDSSLIAHSSMAIMLNQEQQNQVEQLLAEGLGGFISRRQEQLAKASGINQAPAAEPEVSQKSNATSGSIEDLFKKDPESALKQATSAAQKGDLKAQLVLGRWYVSQSNMKDALIWLSKAAQTDKSVNLDLAKIYLTQNNPLKSIELIEKPADGDSLKILMAAMQMHGDMLYADFKNISAQKVYLELETIHSNKNDFELLSRLTRIHDSIGLDLFAAGKQAEAENVLKKSLEYAEKLKKNYPDRAQTYLLLAVSTGNLARFKSGKDKIRIGGAVEGYCLKAIELNPKLGRPYSILATYYWEISKLSWVLKAFARSFLGELPEKSRDDALQLYRTSLENNPEQIYGQYKMGDLLVAMNRNDEAKKHLKIAIELKPLSTGDQRVQQDAKELLKKIGG